MRGVLTTPGAGFRLERHPPSPDLAHVVDLHWHVRWDLPPGAEHVQGVLPFPCVNVGHGSDGPFVAGPVTRRDDRTLRGEGHALGTRIAAGLFGTLSPLPAHALTDRTVTFAEAFGQDAGPRLEHDLRAAPDPAAHRALVEAFLRQHLRTPTAEQLLANRVVTTLLDDPTARVADAARAFGLSTRGLQRVFRRHVGLTPKQVLQRARAQVAVERVAERREATADVAYDLGYADQAHFTNAFREATGRPPGRYRAVP